MSDYRRAERRLKSATPNVRMALAGTRVVIGAAGAARAAGVANGANAPEVAGFISAVRTEPHLRPYVVSCDDGTTRYASAYDLACEDDLRRTLLAPRPAS
jgi:hypothetical protein